MLPPLFGLQILLRPGSKFHLREFLSCISRITAAHPGDAADGKTVGIAVKALVEHLLTIADGEGCSNHLFILSSSFTAHATLQRVLQLICGNNVGAFVHFLQLSGPESDFDHSTSVETAAEGSSTPHKLKQLLQQQQLEFGQSLIGLADKATFNSFMADCEQVADLICHTWLRYLSTASNISLAGSSGHHSDVVLQLGALQLPCKLQQPLLQLESWLLPAQLCPCHQLPMQPPTGSVMAAAAASGAAGDAATTAGLLVLPERSQWHCSMTSQPVLPAPGTPAISADCSVVQLGRHTQLKMPAATAEALARDIAGVKLGGLGLTAPVQEQLLPPAGLALGSAEEEQMMMLDVEQLQAVQQALDSLPSLSNRRHGSSGGDRVPDGIEAYATFFGMATPPTSYGGYGGNANEQPKYTFEYPSNWKSEVPSKVEKGTQGIDGRVVNPKTKDQRAFVITLGRAGEDNKSFRLTDMESTFQSFAGADYDLQSYRYLSSIAVKDGKVFALFVRSPTRAFTAAEPDLRHIVDTFRLL
eukprot:gene3835-4092_t